MYLLVKQKENLTLHLVPLRPFSVHPFRDTAPLMLLYVALCALSFLFKYFSVDKEARQKLLLEAAVFKTVNRQKHLEASQDGAVEKDDVIVSLLADLQQEQDQESEKLVNEMQDKVTCSLEYWVPCGG